MLSSHKPFAGRSTPWAFFEVHDIAGQGIIVGANGEKVCRVYGENRDAQMVGTIILFAVNKVAELATAIMLAKE